MNKIFIDAKKSKSFFVVCWIMYAIVGLGRTSYVASIAYIVSEGVFTKSQAGFTNAIFYVFYAVGMFTFGILADKISPIKLIGVGIGISTIINFLMPFTQNYYLLTALWSINGIGQSTIFPSLIYIISNMLVKEHRQKACMYITFTYTASKLLANCMTAFVAKLFNWRVIFIVAGFMLLGLMILWIMKSLAIREQLTYDEPYCVEEPIAELDNNTPVVKISLFKLMFTTGLIAVLLPAALRSLISFGIESWMPTMMVEIFNASPGFSTILANFIPIINIAGAYCATILTVKVFKSEIGTSAFFFAISIPLLFSLLYMSKIGIVSSTIILSFASTFMITITQCLNIMLPTHFSKFGRVSTIAGMLNTMSSIGAASASYGFGYIAEKYGWNATIWSWIIISAIAFLLCIIGLFQWIKFGRREKI